MFSCQRQVNNKQHPVSEKMCFFPAAAENASNSEKNVCFPVSAEDPSKLEPNFQRFKQTFQEELLACWCFIFVHVLSLPVFKFDASFTGPEKHQSTEGK